MLLGGVCNGMRTVSSDCECPHACVNIDHPTSCVSSDCSSGCRCPSGAVSDVNGQCVHTSGCTCIDNEGNSHANNDVVDSECEIW